MFNKRIRAWHKKDKKMYKVSALDFQENEVELTPFMLDEENVIINTSFDEVHFMQESGLEDDHGFNAFEGDILDFEGTLFVLTYGWYGIPNGENAYGWHLDGKTFKIPYFGGAEKVGTVFENPELVKGDNYRDNRRSR